MQAVTNLATVKCQALYGLFLFSVGGSIYHTLLLLELQDHMPMLYFVLHTHAIF